MDRPLIALSARKHGVPDETIHHAFNHPIRTEQLDEALTMLMGQTVQAISTRSVSSIPADGPLVVHAMTARPKYLR